MSHSIIDVLTIVAILLGPIVALQLQTMLDKSRTTRSRKLSVFKTLMTYRATTLAPHFVEALNVIDVEFTADSEKPVRDAWKVLLDHFSDLGEMMRSGATISSALIDKSATLTTALLITIGKSLGYDFDEVQIKKGAYYLWIWATSNKNNTSSGVWYLTFSQGSVGYPSGSLKISSRRSAYKVKQKMKNH
jgi:hypothetical protein